MFGKLMEIVGFSVCHQIAGRSLVFGQTVAPLCSRCSGIYMGFVVTGIILFVMFRRKQSELPPLYVKVILALFFLSTIIDGLFSYLGIYSTNNIVRFVSGTLCGSAIVIFLYPVFNFQYYRKPERQRVFSRPFTFIIYCLLITAFLILSLLQPAVLGTFYYYFSSISVILTFFFVSLVMMFLIPGFSQKAVRLFSVHLIVPSVLAIFLTALELFMAYGIHRLMNRLAA